MQNPLDDNPEWRAWVASRPPQIQRAIRQYPIGGGLEYAGERLYLIGWAETDNDIDVTLIFSRIDPFEDYDVAHRPENKVYVCEHHLEPVNPKYVE